jgi:hypothetical protein
MDYFLQDSAHITNSLSLNEPAGSTLEDKLTHKRWARSVLTFYACLFLAGATAIAAHQTVTSSSGTEQHVSLRTDVRSNTNEEMHK